MAKVLELWLQVQQAARTYEAVVAGAWGEANRRFTAELDRLAAAGTAPRQPEEALKLWLDGALGSRGAALLEPYSDEPTTSGLMTTPPHEIYVMTLAAARAGFQTCIHAIGDRGNRVAMDVFERVQREVPGARNSSGASR